MFLNFPLNVCHHGYGCCCYHHCHYFAWRIIPGGSRWLLRNCLEMPFWECGSVPASPKHWEVWACMGNKNNPCTDLPKETVNRHANIQSDMKCRRLENCNQGSMARKYTPWLRICTPAQCFHAVHTYLVDRHRFPLVYWIWQIKQDDRKQIPSLWKSPVSTEK